MRSTRSTTNNSVDAAQPNARMARREALAHARRGRRLHAITALVALVGLIITAALVVASAVAHDHNEDRLLQQRAHETATVAASSVGALQGQLVAAAVAADATSSDTPFREYMEPLVQPGARFVSASVWPLDAAGDAAAMPTVVVGKAPVLLQEPGTSIAALLDGAARTGELSVQDLLGRSERRLGYAYALPGGDAVVYAEAALPKNRKATIAADAAFADLDYALYLGDRTTPSHMLASSSGQPLANDRRTASDRVPFGNATVLVEVSPRGELGGALLANLPWILAALGLVITIGAAIFTERLIRRRERAEELSDQLEVVAERNAQLYGSQRAIAQELQRSLVPQSLPQLDGLETAARYIAGVEGTEVGGDWYDVLPISGTRLVFSVGDVCGRGIAAAARMASLRYSIRAYALEHANPASILDRLNAMTASATTRDDSFATVVCGMIDTVAGTLTVARAGHPDLLMADELGGRYLDSPLGPPIGVDSIWSYDALTTQLPDPVNVLAFTDGLVERRTESLDVGLERLRMAVSTSDLPIDRLVTSVVESLAVDGSSDDIAVLGLRWSSPMPPSDPPPEHDRATASSRVSAS